MFKKLWNKLRGKKMDDNEGFYDVNESCVPEIPYVSQLEQLPTAHTKKKASKKKVKKVSKKKSKKQLLLEKKS